MTNVDQKSMTVPALISILIPMLMAATAAPALADLCNEHSKRQPGLGASAGAPARDWYLTHAPRRPKAEIAEYVRSQGIPTPLLFKSFGDALAYGKPVIARSEFWREYFEAAGLFESHFFDPHRPLASYQPMLDRFRADGDEKALWDGLNRLGGMESKIAYYSRLTGQSAAEVMEQAGYTYWQLLGGYNRAMIADSAVPGRYHLMTGTEYAMIEDGKIVTDVSDFDPDRYRDVEKMVAFYEKVRHLDRFDPAHCPVIEFQSFAGENYFLQYHRSRDQNLATFRLDRPLEAGESEAAFVRGATPPEGIEVEVEFRLVNGEGDDALQGVEAAYFKFMGDKGHVYGEMVTREMKVWFQIPEAGSTQMKLNGHLSLSTAFNPEIYVGLDRKLIFPVNPLQTAMANPGQKISRRVRIVSDGRKAYVKPL